MDMASLLEVDFTVVILFFTDWSRLKRPLELLLVITTRWVHSHTPPSLARVVIFDRDFDRVQLVRPGYLQLYDSTQCSSYARALT